MQTGHGMTEVYVSLVCDRHGDPEPEVFTSKDLALADARARFEAIVKPELIDETDLTLDGCLLILTYEEGDFAMVFKRELR